MHGLLQDIWESRNVMSRTKDLRIRHGMSNLDPLKLGAGIPARTKHSVVLENEV